jgi:hypothetical protein
MLQAYRMLGEKHTVCFLKKNEAYRMLQAYGMLFSDRKAYRMLSSIQSANFSIQYAFLEN